MARELLHEGVAEATDLVVGATLWIKVATALGTAHIDAGESILEDLLETEELEDREVDRRVETETTLIGAESRVELDTIATVHMRLSLVVLPDDTELDDALWDLFIADGFESVDGNGATNGSDGDAPERPRMHVHTRGILQGKVRW